MSQNRERRNKMAQNEKDSQHIKYILTQNNPEKYEIDEGKIFEILGEMGQKLSLVYSCFAKEIGNEEHTPHYHIFLNFSSKTRFSAIQQRFKFAHIEPAKGSVEQNIAYVEKSGIWAESEKHDTIIEGSFQEWGNRPEPKKEKMEKSSNNYYKNILEKINEGYTNAEIYEYDPRSIKGLNLDKVREDAFNEKFKKKIRDMEVIYIYGKTGVGKTTAIYDLENFYCVSDQKYPFDKYNYENILVFDEFRETLGFSMMLKILDKFPLELPARYANRTAAYTKVFLLSNWSLMEQYKNIKEADLEAFHRRIHKVQVYQKVFNFNGNYYVRVLEFSCKDYLKNPNIPLEISVEQVGKTTDKFQNNVIEINKNPDFIEESSNVLNNFEYCQESIFE